MLQQEILIGKLVELIKDELKARLAFMSRIINEENIHFFKHLTEEAMKNIITLKVEDKKKSTS